MSRTDETGALVATLALVGAGLLFANSVLVTAAIIPIVYALYGILSGLPADRSLAATREFHVAGATPGEQVSVALTVENDGSRVLPDVRVIDGVPDELAVVDGSPRSAVALSPGESTTLRYRVVLKRGRFEFDDPAVRVRSLAGTDVETFEVQAAGDTTMTCANAISHPPLSEATLPHAGAVATNAGGSGLEFFATRQYHHGDPQNRINWHQVAKTGEFVTVQYRRERAARTVIIVDCRPKTRVTSRAGYPTGAAMAAYAGERLYDALEAAGVTTSVTAVGLSEELDHLVGPDGLPWIHAGSRGSATVLFRSIHRLASNDPAPLDLSVPPGGPDPHARPSTGGPARADGGDTSRNGTDTVESHSAWTRKLLSRLPGETQVILCSPLVDDWPVELCRELAVRSYATTVVAPDVTTGDTAGQRLAGIHRRQRSRTLSGLGVRTADWRIDQPIDATLLAAFPDIFER